MYYSDYQKFVDNIGWVYVVYIDNFATKFINYEFNFNENICFLDIFVDIICGLVLLIEFLFRSLWVEVAR